MAPTDDVSTDGPDVEPTPNATGDPDGVLDAHGQRCGLVEPALKDALDALEPGEVVEVRADDPSVPAGLASWCRLTGNELVATETAADGTALLRVRKA